MTSSERVRNAIALQSVDRLPLYFFAFGETDIVELFVKPPRAWIPKDHPPYYLDYESLGQKTTGREKKEDEWGTLWQFGETLGIVPYLLDCPIKSADQFDRYVLPDPLAPGRFDAFEARIQKEGDKYIVALQAGLLFERVYQLRGFSETLVDIHENPERIASFLDRLVDFQVSIIRRLSTELPGRVHAFKATDDWGTQDSMVIHPDLWREIFKPRYRRIIDEVHRRGMHFWLHSDGQIRSIIPDLIEIGVDVLDVPQPTSVFNTEFLGKTCAGKVCLCLYTDIQSTLVHGTREEIEKEAQDLIFSCSCPGGGGIIASDYPDGDSIGASLRNREASLSAFKLAFRKRWGDGKGQPGETWKHPDRDF